jgi:molecular chaperone GrpE (heat shock protein)
MIDKSMQTSVSVAPESEPIGASPDDCRVEPAAEAPTPDLLQLFAALEKVADNRNALETLTRVVESLEAQVRDLRTKAEERRLISALAHIVSLEDSIYGLAREPESKPDLQIEPIDWSARVATIQKLTREALLRAGLTAITPVPGDLFDSKIHDVIDVVESNLANEHLRISVVHRPGYKFAGRLLRPASVTVLRNQPSGDTSHE